MKWPKQYEKMAKAIEMDPPSGSVRDAIGLYETLVCNAMGPPWTDEHLARVFAWSMMAGFPECCALSVSLSTVIQVASYRFSIRGGCIPDIELMKQLIDPLKLELKEQGNKTPWLASLFERYKITGAENIDYKSNFSP